MQSEKQVENLKKAILIPCYKRHEYTEQCIKSLEEAQEYKNTTFRLVDDGSNDNGITQSILQDTKLPKKWLFYVENVGLRNVLIDFITWARAEKFDIIGCIGNDCMVPGGWLNELMDIKTRYKIDIISPNVFPSNPAFKLGQEVPGEFRYRLSQIVGGLWFMDVSLTDDIVFDKHEVKGITGAFNVLQQIIIEKDPMVSWAPDVVVQDMGHWSGRHPKNIKSEEHKAYYAEVGRGITW